MKLLSLFIVIIFLFCGCSTDNYKKVKIGDQIWMTENLNADHFRNGDIIPEAKSNEDWEKAGNEHKPVWCYFANDTSNGKWYGKLYNWYAVIDPRGLAPKGWHIPTKAEFQTLITSVNGNSNALKEVGQGEEIGSGTNTSGFSALLVGCRILHNEFYNLGGETAFWSSSKYGSGGSFFIGLEDFDNYIHFGHLDEEYGFSVRCIND